MSQNKRYAAYLNAVISVLGIIFSLGFIIKYGTDVPDGQPPFGVNVAGIIFSLVGLLGSWAILQGKRWGVILTLVINVLNLLLSLPGVFFGEGFWLKLSAVLGVVLSAVVIYLLVAKDRRTSVAQH